MQRFFRYFKGVNQKIRIYKSVKSRYKETNILEFIPPRKMPVEPIAKPSSVNFSAPYHISHVTDTTTFSGSSWKIVSRLESNKYSQYFAKNPKIKRTLVVYRQFRKILKMENRILTLERLKLKIDQLAMTNPKPGFFNFLAHPR